MFVPYERYLDMLICSFVFYYRVKDDRKIAMYAALLEEIGVRTDEIISRYGLDK